MNASKPKISAPNVILRVVWCVLILAIGALGLVTLAKMRRPPNTVAYTERPLQVETLVVQPEKSIWLAKPHWYA